MANQNADVKTNQAALPPVRTKANRIHGRIRFFEATITPLVALAIGDTISWGDFPLNCRPVGHLAKLYFSNGTAACTLNLGDAANPVRHLAATAINAAGSAVPEAAAASGAQFETTDSTTAVTNNCTLISTVAGAAIPIGQVLTLKFPYVCD